MDEKLVAAAMKVVRELPGALWTPKPIKGKEPPEGGWDNFTHAGFQVSAAHAVFRHDAEEAVRAAVKRGAKPPSIANMPLDRRKWFMDAYQRPS